MITCHTNIYLVKCKVVFIKYPPSNAFESQQIHNSLSMYVAFGVALVNSLHKSVVRHLFVAFMSAFQGHVACRNLPLTGPHNWYIFENDFFSASDTRRHTRKKKIRVLPSGVEPKTFRLLVQMVYH